MPKKATAKKQEKVTKEKVSQEEFEKKVLELASKGLTSEKIGESLKLEGIHPKEYSKKISQILKEKGKYINPDLKNVNGKLEAIKVHFEKNKQDKRALRDRERIFSKLRKLKRYYSAPQ